MKNEYLSTIEQLLTQFVISKAEIKDIISDYDQMFEDGLAKGMTEAEVIEFLGTPEKIARDFSEDFSMKIRRKRNHKITALMPFLAVITFFVLGNFGYWHPGWMVFLLIPIVAILNEHVGKRNREMIISLSPFIAVITFLLIGFITKIWHPTWLVFLIVPVNAIMFSKKHTRPLDSLIALSPFVAMVIFFILGHFNLWHPGWLVFMIIPMLAILHDHVKWRLWALEASFVVSIGLYLYLFYAKGVWGLSLYVFLIPVAVGILFSDIDFRWSGRPLIIKLLVLASIAVYVLFGVWLGTWPYLWVVFFSVPIYAILTEKKGRGVLSAISPFVAITLFFYLGYFGKLWSISWLAFLLIPIVAILEGK